MDYGLVGGLARGLQQGLGAYIDQTRYNQNKAIQQQQLKRQGLLEAANLKEHGLIEDPNSPGSVQYTPEMQQQKDYQSKVLQTNQALETPGSPELKAYQTAHRAGLNMIQPGLGNKMITDDMTASQIEKLSPLEKMSGGVAGAMLRAQATAGLGRERMDLQNDRFSQKTLNDYDKKQHVAESQIDNANRAQSIISQVKDGKEIKANKALSSELSGIMASLANQGKPATVYGMSHQEFDSAQGRVRNALNFLKGESETTIAPDQLEQLNKDIGALKNEWALQHERQHRAFSASTPDRVKPAVQTRYETFRQDRNFPVDSRAPQASGSVPGGLVQQPQGLVPQSKPSLDDIQKELQRRGIK